MTVFSHILATYFLGKIFKVKDIKTWILLWGFGVLIDLDAVILRPLQTLNPAEWYYHYDNPRCLRTFIQEPISLLWLLPLSYFVFKNFLPVLAFLLHLMMDYIEIKIKRPFWPASNLEIYQGILKPGSKVEIVLSCFFLLILSYDQARRKNSGLRTFFRRSREEIKKIRA